MGTAFAVSDFLVMLGKGRVLMMGTPDEFKTFFLNDLKEKVKMVKTAGVTPQ